jgi:hypothetical protein
MIVDVDIESLGVESCTMPLSDVPVGGVYKNENDAVLLKVTDEASLLLKVAPCYVSFSGTDKLSWASDDPACDEDDGWKQQVTYYGILTHVDQIRIEV